MAHAYTPGLKVSARTRIRKARVLPLAGEVLVEPGASVQASSAVAEAELPGDVHPVNVAGLLGVPPEEVAGYMLKALGEQVGRDEPLARTRPWLKWLRSVCRSPVAGSLESASEVTGQVMVREPPQRIALSAYISGTVTETQPGEGVVVETEAALVQGIFGVGGECFGPLKMLAQSPDGLVGPGALDSSCENCIIVVGAEARAELLSAARKVGVAAVVAGGIRAQELKEVLGYDIGVAVTGAEQIGLTLMLTEGFGRIPIARRTFELLDRLEGLEASACGATQIRAGVLRPEVIVPLEGAILEATEGEPAAEADGIAQGDAVRIIRRPHFGLIGEVVELAADPVRVETEALVRVLRVRADDGEVLTVPRANTEIIET